jgi:hypothetical protein
MNKDKAWIKAGIKVDKSLKSILSSPLNPNVLSLLISICSGCDRIRQDKTGYESDVISQMSAS